MHFGNVISCQSTAATGIVNMTQVSIATADYRREREFCNSYSHSIPLPSGNSHSQLFAALFAFPLQSECLCPCSSVSVKLLFLSQMTPFCEQWSRGIRITHVYHLSYQTETKTFQCFCQLYNKQAKRSPDIATKRLMSKRTIIRDISGTVTFQFLPIPKR